jgi:hypothetical protein
VVALSPLAAAGADISYNRDVRPILARHCFACHGPDAKHREAELRLDDRTAALEHKAFIPGKPQESELIRRITSDDPEQRMPPPHTKRELSAQEKDILQRWIADGATYEGHWAFLPVGDPKPPKFVGDAWSKNAIDAFILAELRKHDLHPSPEADRATLIRRLSLDLLGLVPSPEEVAAFVADDRPAAYEQLVERLLASPHYGERWGRHWLDQARYADSNGYTIDSERAMWPYRDWVIRALNDDMPFDQFTIEQLAGDLLPQATKLQRIATAFHRNTMINEEGGTDAEQFRNEVVFDRVNATGSVWLGLTLGCAQCHSHKFDPTSHREYYELFAFFNSGSDVNNRGETVDVLPGEILGDEASAAVDRQAAETAKERVAQLKREAAARQAAWEQQVAAGIAEPKWIPMDIDRFDAGDGRTLKKLDDGSILATKEGPAKDTYELLVSAKVDRLAALRLVVLPHDSLPGGGPGTAGNGNFVLTEIEVNVDGKPARLKHALADHEKPGYAVLSAIDGRRDTGWALHMEAGGHGEHQAWFFFEDPLPMTTGKITVRLRHDVNDHYLIGRFNFFATDTPPAVHPDRKTWEKTVAAAQRPPAERDKESSELLSRVFMALDGELAVAQRAADQAAKDTRSAATLMVMRELEKPRTTYLLSRGDFLLPDKQLGPLTPNTPAWLPPLVTVREETPKLASRLDLARWLVRSDHPLTPRVAVNRVWMRYFGAGLVESENDFGLQGTSPSHPELLDYLAGSFVRSGWSQKALHRLIVTSATYRQASTYRPELAEIDPHNRFLARQNRLRLDAETLRDAALSAAGALEARLGGPTTHPPQPDGVYAFTQNKKAWPTDTGGDRFRRALYTTFIRSAPYPLFTTFDAPSFATACTRRPRSNTPLQALTVANDEVFVELAQQLAERTLSETGSGTTDQARIERLFRLALIRAPNEREVVRLVSYLQHMRASFASTPDAAKLAAGKAAQGDVVEQAAWTAVARVLLNTDEFITRE